MTSYALLFTLSAIGISETVYLIKKRKAQEKPVCFLRGDCHKVLESKYSKIFGIHNDIWGLLFYSAIFLIIAFLVVGAGPQGLLDVLVNVIIFGGVIMSLFFIYLQWRVIKDWCSWCLLSAITIFLMGIIVLITKLT